MMIVSKNNKTTTKEHIVSIRMTSSEHQQHYVHCQKKHPHRLPQQRTLALEVVAFEATLSDV
jgi:hypothetical protein